MHLYKPLSAGRNSGDVNNGDANECGTCAMPHSFQQTFQYAYIAIEHSSLQMEIGYGRLCSEALFTKGPLHLLIL
jgi:hypothetical protein